MTNSGVAAGRWRPKAGLTWQWQLSGPLDLSVPAVYDVDLFDTTAVQVARLHSLGRRAICYLDAGTWEPYRPDSAAFSATLLGKAVAGFPDERWLDIRQTRALLALLAKRMDLCKAKGFDGVEPDNLDGYANSSGFALTPAEQIRFNLSIAHMAHSRGLAVALKNDLDQVAQLQSSFDMAVNEQCVEYDECHGLRPFIKSGKPVLHVEYNLPTARFCSVTRALRFSSLEKHESLDAFRIAC